MSMAINESFVFLKKINKYPAKKDDRVVVDLIDKKTNKIIQSWGHAFMTMEDNVTKIDNLSDNRSIITRREGDFLFAYYSEKQSSPDKLQVRLI